jgi:sporulation protein YlmC with PRC-barrel domain
MVPEDSSHVEQLPDLDRLPVYTAAGVRFGEAVDLVLDLHETRVAAVLVEDVPTVPDGVDSADAAGVRVPYRYVAGIDDVVVLNVSLGLDRRDGQASASTDESDAAEAEADAVPGDGPAAEDDGDGPSVEDDALVE